MSLQLFEDRLYYKHQTKGDNMKIGDLVKHREGELGILLEIDHSDNTIRLLWTDGSDSWTFMKAVEVVCLTN